MREGSELTAMVIVGGIAPDDWPLPEAEIERIAGDLGIPAERLAERVEEVYYVDDLTKRRILDALPKLGNLIAQMSHDAARVNERLDSIAALAGREPQRRET